MDFGKFSRSPFRSAPVGVSILRQTPGGRSPWNYTIGTRLTALSCRADDLIAEENETVALALKRLPAQESYDRVFRLRRAMQASITHKVLPKAEWTKAEEDTPYLAPLIAQIEAEAKEKTELDSLTIVKSH